MLCRQIDLNVRIAIIIFSMGIGCHGIIQFSFHCFPGFDLTRNLGDFLFRINLPSIMALRNRNRLSVRSL